MSETTTAGTAPTVSSPTKPISLADKIKNEIILNQRLENLNVQASGLAKAFTNSFLGERSKEYKEWVSIGEDIKGAELTEEGKLRLGIKQQLMEDRVIPNHSLLLMTTLPFALYWALKKGATYFVSSRLEAYQKTQARTKRRLEQAKGKETRKLSKAPVPQKPRRKY
jgi:hypothetical protein